jgi:inhibitor of cysteine peptidase
MEFGESASVESIELLQLESFPVQVNAVLRGNLPDGCTEIEHVEQNLRGNVFELKVITRRPKDAMCTMALAPFEERVALEVNGLAAGEYTVRAGEQEASFRFDVDNILRSE